jgi:hypothetical protein
MFDKILVSSVFTILAVQEPQQVPVSLVGAASQDPLSMVNLLAEAAIPAGAEIRQSDYQRFTGSPRRWDPERLSRERFAQETTVPADRLVAAFNQSHATYRALMMGGVLVIRPARDRAPYLDGGAPMATLSARGLMPLAERMFVPLDPRLAQEGGRAGSLVGPIGVELDRGDDLQLVVEARGKTVIQVLNDIARQAPGHAWLVVTMDGDRRIERFGFMHRYGTTSEQSLQ